MKILLDTNIFFSDFRLRGNAFRVLFEAAERLGVQLLIPQVVIDEVVGKFHSSAKEILVQAEKVNIQSERLFAKKHFPETEKLEIDELSKQYRKFLQKSLENVGAVILPYPRVGHKKIARRAIQHRKPFKENGTGYRDTLIWFSILDHIKLEGEQIILITKNIKDFGEQAIFPDLREDLETFGLAEDSVTIINSLEQFNSTHVIPRLEQLKEMIRKFDTGSIEEFSIEDWIKTSLKNELEAYELGDVFVGIEQGHADIRISELKNVNKIKFDDVRLLPSGDLLVFVTSNVTADIMIDATWEQYKEHLDLQEWIGEDEEPFQWITMFLVESADVKFSLILQKDTYNVLSCTINAVDGNLCSVEFNPHPVRTL